MEWRSRVFARISVDNPLHQCCHKFTLEPFIVITGGWAIQAWCKWSAGFSWEQKHLNEILHQYCTFLFRQFLFKNVIRKRYWIFSSFTYMKLCTSFNVKRFLICFAWNLHLQKTINDPLNVSAFDFIYNHVRRFFRFPQNNIRQYSCITLIKMQCKTQP